MYDNPKFIALLTMGVGICLGIASCNEQTNVARHDCASIADTAGPLVPLRVGRRGTETIMVTPDCASELTRTGNNALGGLTIALFGAGAFITYSARGGNRTNQT